MGLSDSSGVVPSDTTVSFHTNVSYECQEGYFFERDIDFLGFNVTCLPGGEWTQVGEWGRCWKPEGNHLSHFLLSVAQNSIVLDRFCASDPPAPPLGGSYTWDSATFSGGRSPYSLIVTYSCERGKGFRDGETGEVWQTMTAQCMWDQTWEPPVVRNRS